MCSRKLLLSVLPLLGVTSAKFSCLDDSGDAVDWFIGIKKNADADIYYMDANGGSELKKSSKGMGGDDGAIPLTLAQVYDAAAADGDYAYAMYNDEDDEEKKSESHAHSKGVLLTDEDQGFWLIHSLPRFPNRVSTGYGDLPSLTYGQSFFCVTLDADAMDDVAGQMIIHDPQVYDSKVDSVSLPTLSKWLDGSASADDTSNTISLKTVGGQSLKHFGKSKEWAKELYQDLIAPGLKANLKVESWMNGELTNKIPSSCKSDGFDYDVLDISVVKMSDDTEWKETQDHAKYAVADDGDHVCIGDINRQYSQSGRGGGSLCIDDSSVSKAFDAIVDTVAPCNETKTTKTIAQ